MILFTATYDSYHLIFLLFYFYSGCYRNTVHDLCWESIFSVSFRCFLSNLKYSFYGLFPIFIMSYHTNTDNIYELGAQVTAKVDPALKLIIVKYYQRIYYCAEADNPSGKHLAYFENELNPFLG